MAGSRTGPIRIPEGLPAGAGRIQQYIGSYGRFRKVWIGGGGRRMGSECLASAQSPYRAALSMPIQCCAKSTPLPPTQISVPSADADGQSPP